MADELVVGLRVQAKLGEARAEVRRLRGELDGLNAAGARAGTGATGNAAAASTAATERATRAQRDAEKAAAAAAAQLDKERAAVDRLAASLAPAAAATDKLAATQQQLDSALAKGIITQERHAQLLQLSQRRFNDLGVSVGQTRAAMRQLPAQITDIVTSLASGMPVFTVAIQQGGQIKDSFGGFGAAAKGLASVFTPLRLLLGGVAGAIGAVGVAAYQGSREADAYNRSLILSGNVAGTTAGQMAEMARRIDGVVGTQAAAAAALSQMAEGGRVANSNLERFTTVAIQMEREAGQAVQTTVKHFADLAKSPVDAALKLNEQYHFLTASVYEQIKALEEQGRVEQAGEVAQRAYADAMAGRAQQLQQNLGYIERAWRGIKGAAAEAWDAMLGIGRRETAQQQLEAVTRQIAERQANSWKFGGADPGLEKLRGQQAMLQETLRLEQRGAELTAERAKDTERLAAWEKEGDQYKSQSVKREEALNRERVKGEQLVRRGLITQAQADQRLKDVQDKLKDRGGSKGPSAFRTASADAGVAMAQLQADLGVLQATLRSRDAIVQRALETGELSIAEAYRRRLAQLQEGGEAERKALQAELQEARDAIAKAGNSAESGPLRQRAIQLEARIKTSETNLAEESRKLGVWKEDQERQLAGIAARIRVEVSAVTGQFDRRAVAEQLQAQYRDAMNQARGSGTSDDVARVQLLIDAGVAQAEFNHLLAQTQQLQAALGAQEGELQRQVQSGQLSQIEAEGRLRALRADQVPALQAIVQQLQAVRDALPPEAQATIGSMSTQISQLQTTVRAATPTVVDFGTQIRSGLIDAVGDSVQRVGGDFKSLPDVVKQSLRQVLMNILSSGIKKALTDALTPDTNGRAASGGSSGGSLWGAIGTLISGLFAAGGPERGYEEGGKIVGPGTGTSDSIPAMVDGRRPIRVSNGEWIQPERAVKHYGPAFMEAVRTLRLPRPTFAFGGLVSAYRGATKYAAGGPVAGSSGQPQAANVSVQLVNNGTPQRVERQDASYNGREVVIGLVLSDLRDGGPISRGIDQRMGR